MPLLKRKVFEKSTASEYLRDDDEVFHCEITDEIFKDYDEYCERIILVNSMVWSCEMTGKNNLTYSEALESERNARKSLRDFPMELRTPIIFLASITKRCSFAEMTEDVFNYVRERYFVGETVEACLEGNSWREAHILSVTTRKIQPSPSDNKVITPAFAYSYEVEQFDDSESSATGQIGTAPYDLVRRRKGLYTRDRNRLFLKQFVEQGPGGIIVIKPLALQKYNINKVMFDQIFTGVPPVFASSKKFIKNSMSPQNSTPKIIKPNGINSLNKSTKKPSPDKKAGRQESLDKYIKKADKPTGTGTNATSVSVSKSEPKKEIAQEPLVDQMRRAGEQMRQRKLEEKARKKERNARLQAYLKEWQKAKDDLELEDHKILPKGTPIDIPGIPQKYFGDFLSVLEFVHLYAEILKTKDIFHNGLDIETFRKALTLKENSSVFSDFIQMMLTTIFSLQEDEAEEYNERRGIEESTGVLENGLNKAMGVTKAVELATKASKWPQTYLGTPLSQLPLDVTTVTEVLRLHLLSSGSAPGSRCATWRYQQRGGYSSLDDAGLYLRVSHPDTIRRLVNTHVADLSFDDKFKIIQCLMNQILSYATVRDIIEEKIETIRLTKQELRALQITERRREIELVALRQKLKKETIAKKEELKLTGEAAKALDDQLLVSFEKLTKESEAKKADHEKKLAALQAQCFDLQSYIGADRAHRRYWLNQCVPGLFVETIAEDLGPCRDKPVQPMQLPKDEDVLSYVQKLFESERYGSDKENDSGASPRVNSPKKHFMNLNGLSQKSTEPNPQVLRDLLVCTSKIQSCPVHGSEVKPLWHVFYKEEEIDLLIQSLNKRGIRESELRHNLEVDKKSIVDYIKKCPLYLLNPAVAPPNPMPPSRQKKIQGAITVPPDSTLSEALEMLVREYILELEEKVYHGCLGGIKVKDRQAWRGTLLLRSYDKQAEYLTWGPNKQYRDDYHLPNGKLKAPPDNNNPDVKPIMENKYREPGYYLGEGPLNSIKEESGGAAASQDVVRSLASALLQVEQCVNQKYYKRPLGLDDKERKDRDAKGKPLDLEALERWEVSLMECRSFAQIALHLFTLDSSISWSASILNANCRLCRRKTDPDNMLLCDGCNKGHHLYCLKPKLTKVPVGDWFCDQCKPKERTPRKKRKLFSDDDIEDEIQESSSDEESMDLGVCASCGSGGILATSCNTCGGRWHTECAKPKPLRSNTRSWTCSKCLAPHRDSYDSDDNTTLAKQRKRRSRPSKEPSPAVNGLTNGHGTSNGRKSRRSKDELNTSSKRKSRTSGTSTPTSNGHREESRSRRKRGSRVEPTFHMAALEELLKDITKNKDSWPFYEPVSLDEVPDYLKVIDEPMEFQTIAKKLTRGKYDSDEQFMRDAALVFTNCYTYNKESHIVAKAGIRLQKYFSKRCKELGIVGLSAEMDEYVESSNKQHNDDELPRVKRPKVGK